MNDQDPPFGPDAAPASPAPTPASRPSPRPLPEPAPAGAATALPIGSSALERLALEMLAQQRNERRWRIFFRLAWLFLVLMVIWLLFASGRSWPRP